VRANLRDCSDDEVVTVVVKQGRRDIISPTMTVVPSSGIPTNQEARCWLSSVLTDVHFWVPVLVLIGGLLLLRYVR